MKNNNYSLPPLLLLPVRGSARSRPEQANFWLLLPVPSTCCDAPFAGKTTTTEKLLLSQLLY